MKLYVNLFSLDEFLTLYSDNEYLQKVLIHNDGNVYIIDTNDLVEIERLLNSRRIKYKIK